jgi:hypothetical protein
MSILLDNINILILEQEVTNIINNNSAFIFNFETEAGNINIPHTKDALKDNEDELKRKTSIDILKTKSIINKHAKKLKINKKTNPETLNSIISKTMMDSIDEMKKEGVLDGLTIGAVLTLIPLLLNTIALSLFLILFNGDKLMALFATGVLIAPFTEEFTKFLSVKMKATAGHFLAFNAFEFFSYVFGQGVSAFSRIIPIIIHFINTLIHKHYSTLSKNAKNRRNRKKIEENSLPITIIIHALYNSAGVVLISLVGELLKNTGGI